ncbi:hypothetical protein ALO_15617 [Acetonema longum DSM 6540]|uniref:Uncharacterized protein n=1 Tax=Acetonema longum DSM 6540 TaxID=1009370 RepID=F7NLZ7_9FIRM|nr:hypothetical protein ALO_15617 [Acetonema longum DSM 6540]
MSLFGVITTKLPVAYEPEKGRFLNEPAHRRLK